MAKLPIEIVQVGGAKVENLDKIVEILNNSQDAFDFVVLRDKMIFQYNVTSKNIFTTNEIYDQFMILKNRIKGYHPHLIGIVDKCLNGTTVFNLFGSMKEENGLLQGLSILTLYQIPQLLKKIPADIYIVFELLSFAIRFLYGKGLIHDKKRNCMFDKKMDKREIVDSIKDSRICEPCRLIIRGILDEDQNLAIEKIFNIIKEVANSDNPEASWNAMLNMSVESKPRIFLCHSSKDKEFVRRLANDLIDKNCRVWFDEWDIKIGENIVLKIEEGLRKTDFLAIILSKPAIESAWVKNEWTAKFMKAADNKQSVILPVLIEECEIPLLLQPFKYADFRNKENYKSTFDYFIRNISALNEETV